MRRFLSVILFLAVVHVSHGQETSFYKHDHKKVRHARRVFRKAIATRDSALLGEYYYLYGKINLAAGDFLSAKRSYHKSFEILEKLGDSFELGRLYIVIATGEDKPDFNRSLASVKKAISIFERIGSEKGLIRAYDAMAQIYNREWVSMSDNWPPANTDSTLFYLYKMKYLVLKQGNTYDIAGFYGHIGRVLIKSDISSADWYLNEALRIYQKEKKLFDVVEVLLELAQIDISRKKLPDAWEKLRASQRIYDKNGMSIGFHLRSRLASTYIYYYSASGDWKRAAAHMKLSNEINEEQMRAMRKEEANRLNLEFDAEKKDLQLKTQRTELALRSENMRIQQHFTIAIAVMLITTAALCMFFFKLYRKNKRISGRNADLVREQNHRVKNNLQVVSSLLNLQSRQLSDVAAKTAVKESQMRVQAMALLQRRLYDEEELLDVNLKDFITELIETVFHAYGQARIVPEYDIERMEISVDKMVSIGLILNELATNASKYAFPEHQDPAFSISCLNRNGTLELMVKDNGPGFVPLSSADQQSGGRKPSFGMRLIEMQSRQLRATHRFFVQEGSLFTMEFKV